jgi:hypothetical protein
MLRAVQQLDHPGVLADVEAACGRDNVSRGLTIAADSP